MSPFFRHFPVKKCRSRFGYYFDYITGAISYSALFLCLGLGLSDGPYGGWTTALGVAGSVCVLLALVVNIGRDRQLEPADDTDLTDRTDATDSVIYPGFAGFELEDGIYLLAPITWLGFLSPFFLAASIGATVYVLWTLWMWNSKRHALTP